MTFLFATSFTMPFNKVLQFRPRLFDFQSRRFLRLFDKVM